MKFFIFYIFINNFYKCFFFFLKNNNFCKSSRCERRIDNIRPTCFRLFTQLNSNTTKWNVKLFKAFHSNTLVRFVDSVWVWNKRFTQTWLPTHINRYKYDEENIYEKKNVFFFLNEKSHHHLYIIPNTPLCKQYSWLVTIKFNFHTHADVVLFHFSYYSFFRTWGINHTFIFYMSYTCLVYV